jgi:hypothetical protein
MARVGGASRSNLNALYKMMAELGHAIDDKSHGKSTVSVTEAEKIIKHMDGMDPASKTAMNTLMAEALAGDFFTVSDRARVRFSSYLQVPVDKLTPKELGKMAGLQSSRSSFKASMDALSKTPQIDRKEMSLLLSRSHELMPRPLQQFMTAALSQATKDDVIKMDTKARRAFFKEVGTLDNDGGVSAWKEIFEKAGDPSNDYLARLLGSGMCFEDLVSAFMIHMTGKLKEDLKDKMKQMEEMRKAGAKRRDKSGRGMDPMAKKMLGKNLENVQLIDDMGGKTNPAGGGKTSGADGAGKAGSTGKAPSVGETRAHLEAVVQSAHKHLNDDGVIDPAEATKIAEKLDRLDGPIADLIAGSLANALRRSGLDLKGDLKPLADWCKSKLGDVDMSPMPKNSSGDPANPWVVSLKDNDKLENKVAGFLVDVLTSSDSTIKETMSELKTFRDDIAQYPASAAAAEKLLQTDQKGAAPQQRALKATRESAPPASNPQANTEAAAQMLNAGKMTPQQLKRAMDAGPSQGSEAGATAGKGRAEVHEDHAISRDKLMEEIKSLMNLISQVTQAMSNIQNTMHQNAMNSIRAIR